MSKKTPLYHLHRQANGQMVDFYGWQLPLHYGSQIKEHQSVREQAGLFDVSHMTIVDLLGAGGREFLRHVLANDIDRLSHPGRALYSCMLNHRGGIIDDLIVYYRAPDNYRLVLNAATRDKDLAWLQKQSNGLSLGLQERHDLAMLAVQGPAASTACQAVLSPACMDAASTLGPFEAVDVNDWFIARTGYTGEEGYEIIVPTSAIEALWESFIEQGVTPCGLGARDSLRLEAGCLLYGQDMDENTTPFESGLTWTVAMEPTDRDFIGRAALQIQLEQGIKRQFVGLVLEQGGMMRQGQSVFVDEKEVGVITSGGFSPMLKRSIAFARVLRDIPPACHIEIRGKQHAARVVKPRFVKKGRPLI